MDKAILKDLVKRFWKWIVIVGLLVVVFFLWNKTSTLELESKEHLEKAKEHEIKASFYKQQHDNLVKEESALEVKYDSLVLVKDKIKIKYHEKFKIIDKYSVSDMQRYFDERTAE